MARPQLSKLSLWDRHRSALTEVVREAVRRLAEESTATGEVDLNVGLCTTICRVIHERQVAGLEVPTWAPSPDGLNVPSDEDGEVAVRKRPDLQWVYIDPTLPWKVSRRPFTIECKRLGRKSNAGFDFNTAYVRDGISRFTHVDWRYGQNAESAIMVGYVQGDSAVATHGVVNRVAAAAHVPPLSPLVADGTVYESSHVLVRTFVMSPFTLNHIWVEFPAASSAA